MPMYGQGLVMDELLSQLILLLLLVERLNNTLLLLLDGFAAMRGRSVMWFPSTIVLVLFVAHGIGTVFVLVLLQPQAFSFEGNMLFLLEAVLMGLLAECLNDTLLLLFNGWLTFNILVLFDNDVDRFAHGIVLDDLLGVRVMMSTVVKTATTATSTTNRAGLGGCRFDKLQCRRFRLLLSRCRLMMVVHLILVMLRRG